jgi:hypothetical protein
MIQLSIKEHTTALFVIAMYYWFNNDTLNAMSALEVAMHIAKSPVVGDS